MQSIDSKDTDFVVLAHAFSCPLWTNDSKLKELVTSVKIVSTQDLLELIRQ
jgi:predicted nucleic acid-binding protein